MGSWWDKELVDRVRSEREEEVARAWKRVDERRTSGSAEAKGDIEIKR